MRPLSILLALFLLWSSPGCAQFDTYYGKFGSTTLSFELPKDWQETGRNQWSKGGKQLTLGEVRIAEADEANLEERAKQFQSHHSTLQLDKFQPLELGDQTAYFVEYTWGLCFSFAAFRERSAALSPKSGRDFNPTATC